jgi:type IV secretory pathway VirB6-like protein
MANVDIKAAIKEKLGQLLIYAIIYLVLVIVAIVAAAKNDSTTVGANQLTMVNQQTVTVRGDGYYSPNGGGRTNASNFGGWIKSGVNIMPGQDYNIITSGSIYTCSNVFKVGFAANYLYQCPKDPKVNDKLLEPGAMYAATPPPNGQPQNDSINRLDESKCFYINRGDYLDIAIAPPGGAFNNQVSWFRNGSSDGTQWTYTDYSRDTASISAGHYDPGSNNYWKGAGSDVCGINTGGSAISNNWNTTTDGSGSEVCDYSSAYRYDHCYISDNGKTDSYGCAYALNQQYYSTAQAKYLPSCHYNDYNWGNSNSYGTRGIGVGIKIGNNTPPLNDYNQPFGCQGGATSTMNCGTTTAPAICPCATIPPGNCFGNFKFDKTPNSYGVDFYEGGLTVSSAPSSGPLIFESYDHEVEYMSDNVGGYNFNITHLPINCQLTAPSAANPIEMVITNDAIVDNPSNIIKITSANFTATNTSQAGYIWYRVSDKDNNYMDNVGEYYVNTSIINTSDASSSSSGGNAISSLLDGIVNGIVAPVKQQLLNARLLMYFGLVGAPDSPNMTFYQIGIVGLNLYIIFYAVFFLFGIVEINQFDLLKRIIKICVIINLINSRLSWDFFTFYIFNLFEGGGKFLLMNILYSSDYIAQTFTATNMDSNPNFFEQHLFTFVDDTIGSFFTEAVFLKLAALIISPWGILIGYIFIYCMGIFAFTMLQAVIAYLFAMIAVSLMIAVAPIFIMFLLFEKTKPMFDNWIKYMFGFCLQPVLLFLCIIFVYHLAMIAFFNAIAFQVSRDCAISISFSAGSLGNVNLGCLLYVFEVAYDYAAFAQLVLPQVFVFYIFTTLLGKTCTFADMLSSKLTGTSGELGMAGQAGKTIDSVKNSAKSAVDSAKGLRDDAQERKSDKGSDDKSDDKGEEGKGSSDEK